MASKSKRKAEFGDFQTPRDLAARVCDVVASRLPVPNHVIEPTCGIGNFLIEAERRFESAQHFVGIETNGRYLQRAARAFEHSTGMRASLELIHKSFFDVDWQNLVGRFKGRLLVIGNPPWVTNSDLGTLASTNLPNKTNFQGLSGLDAVTGKSNFDISEWMCIRLLEVLPPTRSAFALLVKTAVARKVLLHAWKNDLPLSDAAIFGIDAKRHFNASVDACLLLGAIDKAGRARCPVYGSLEAEEAVGVVGYEDGKLVADVDARAKTTVFTATTGVQPKWRSGVKHDCAKVLELRPSEAGLANGFGDIVDIEPDFLYPLQKSSDVASDRGDGGKRIILPQRSIGQTTSTLETTAPRLWRYLQQHGALLDRRKSSIYRDKPRFSIFGIGEYTFAPWKVSISGLYKRLKFCVQGPVGGRPVVFDDTVYFLPFQSEDAAAHAHKVLCSDLARDFYESFIFWDAKRPITAALLRRLSLEKLGARLYPSATHLSLVDKQTSLFG